MRRAVLAGAVGFWLLSTACATSGGSLADDRAAELHRSELACRARAARAGHLLLRDECRSQMAWGRVQLPSVINGNPHADNPFRRADGRLEPVPIDPRTGEVDRRAWSR